MPVLTRCFCFDIRRGSIASAIYSIIYAAIAVGAAAFVIHQHVTRPTRPATPDILLVEPPSEETAAEEETMFIATCVDISFFSLLFILSILLLYGVKHNKRYYLLPYVVVMSVLVVLQTILLILLLVWLVATFSFQVIIELITVGLFTFINMYCVLCVYAQYQDLRDGRSDMRAVYRAHGTVLQQEGPTGKASEVTHIENSNFVPSYPGPPPSTGPYPGAQNPAPAYPPSQYPYPPTDQSYPASMSGAQGDMPPPYKPPQDPTVGQYPYPSAGQEKV